MRAGTISILLTIVSIAPSIISGAFGGFSFLLRTGRREEGKAMKGSVWSRMGEGGRNKTGKENSLEKLWVSFPGPPPPPPC